MITFKAMKRAAFIAFPLFLLALLSPGFLQAQSVELDNFSVFQHNDEVYLSWTISKGNSCNGIQIERSTDNQTFEIIGYIPGICGSPNFSQPFSHIDEKPQENQVNYYRLELGLQGYSETRQIEFLSVDDDGFQIRPNPAVDQARIVFENNRGELHELEIYSLSGRLVERISGNDNYFELPVDQYPAGLYLLRLTNTQNNKIWSQRMVVAQP